MTERWAAIVSLLVVVVLFWARPVVGAVREWNRERRRYRWDRHAEWERAMDALGGHHGRS